MKIKPNQDAILSKAFAQIEAAAVAGARCPVTAREGIPGLPPGVTTALARAGRVRFEVYAHNWRVAEILAGPHAGKRTQGPPQAGWKPYLVIGTETVRRYQMEGAR